MLTSLHLRDLWAELDTLEAELNEESKAQEKAWETLCELDSENKAEYEEALRAEELDFLPPDTVMRLEIGETLASSRSMSLFLRRPGVPAHGRAAHPGRLLPARGLLSQGASPQDLPRGELPQVRPGLVAVQTHRHLPAHWPPPRRNRHADRALRGGLLLPPGDSEEGRRGGARPETAAEAVSR